MWRIINPADRLLEFWELLCDCVYQIEPGLVAMHLVLDDPKVLGGGCLGSGLQLGNLELDPVEETDLEMEQVGVDANPVAGILPVGGSQVLPFEGTVRPILSRHAFAFWGGV